MVRPARLAPARGEPKARRGVTDDVLWRELTPIRRTEKDSAKGDGAPCGTQTPIS